MNTTRALTASALALAALGAAAGLTACGGAQAATHPARTHATSAPAAAATGIPTLAVSQTPAAILATWYAGGGQTTLATIRSDLGAISTDAGNQDVAATEADGAQLATDADAAMMNGPASGPAAQDWTVAMGDYSMSGTSAASGDFTGATTQMAAGTTEIGDLTALVNSGN